MILVVHGSGIPSWVSLYSCLRQSAYRQVDPDWGVLKSYRTHEDQLAKNMANLERLRRVMTTDLSTEWPASYPQLATYEERMAWCEKEMRQRKDACKEYRKKGIIPSPGYVVFNQIDVT